MGVESKFYILPDNSGYRPDAVNLSALIKSLQIAGFLCDPKSPRFVASAHQDDSLSSHADYEGFHWRVGRNKFAGSLSALSLYLTANQDRDVRVQWGNSDLQLSGLTYPLSKVPGSEGVYYKIEMHLSVDTVYSTSEIIEPFHEIRCSCGAAVEEAESPDGDPFYSSRLPNDCPECCKPMNYAVLPMTIRDGWTGEECEAIGGTTYRFAVVVDCGKYWPGQEAVVIGEFLGVIERTLQIKTRVFRDFY